MLTRTGIKRALRWSAVLVPVVGLAGIWWTGAPSRQVTVSRETTYFTGPVLPNGQIDYVTAVETHLAGDITPQDNAAALMMTVYPVPSAPAENLKQFYSKLGIEQPIGGQEHWVDWHGPAAARLLSPDEDDALGQAEIDELLASARAQPWTQAELPRVHELLIRTGPTLSTLLDAVERSSAWQPALFHDRRSLILWLLVVTENANKTSKQFAVASMYHLGTGDSELAWRYCLGGHRLSRHVAKLGSPMDYLVGSAIEARAQETTATFLQYTSDEDARRRLDEFTQLGPFPDAGDAYDVAGRCSILEMCQSVCYGEPLGENTEGHGMAAYSINLRVDWDEVLKEVNSLFDRTVVAFREPDYFASIELLDGVGESLDLMSMKKVVRPVWAASHEETQDRMLGMVAMVYPAVHPVRLRQAIACQATELLQVALAWKAYRHDKGQRPSDLGDLVPEYLSHVPVDRFSNEAVFLADAADEVIVYSVGPDGFDDDGDPFDIESELGDLTVTITTSQNRGH